MRTLGTRRQFVEHRLAKQAFRFLLLAITISTGCRSIVQHKSNTELVAARQLSLRGADALQRSRPQDAEMLFSEALRRSPLDERAHWGYASTLWNRGDRQRAIEHMREALRLSGTNPEYAIRLGEMSLEMGDRASAADAAKTVLSANRNHAKAWALLGDTHRSEKDWPAALVCYHRALLIQSDYPRVQLSVAEIYRDTGRPQRSLAALDRMTDLRSTASTDPEVLLIRGQALADLNRNEEAAEALAMASERMPSHRIDKQIELVHAQHRIGELVPARMTLGKLLALNSGHPDVTRLQSMLDLSFAHLSDPASTLRSSKNVMVDTQIPTAVGSQNSNSGLDGPAGSRLASPMMMPDASNWVRR